VLDCGGSLPTSLPVQILSSIFSDMSKKLVGLAKNGPAGEGLKSSTSLIITDSGVNLWRP